MSRNVHSVPSIRRQPRGGCCGFPTARVVLFALLGVMSVSTIGCGELEPIVEPEMVDLQLTVDTLKTQVRDAQRSLTELRAELDSRRQELADAQVARAQLEGRVREAERRVSEARHVIELQREELIAARTERERVFRSSSRLQNQLRQLQKKSPKSSNPATDEQDGIPAPTGASIRKGQKAVVVPSIPEAPRATAQAPRVLATPASLLQDIDVPGRVDESQEAGSSIRRISVKPGDTLWSIARKHGVSLDRLRALNHLTDNQINAGQALLVPQKRNASDRSAERSQSNP